MSRPYVVPLDTTLETITQLVEREFRDMICTVLLLDGTRIRIAAAPSMPPAFNRAIEGVEIGPAAGSCGTAAWRKELVVCSDIATDPLWEPWRAIALEHQLRACWSMPVLTRAGTVLGTFAMYYREPRQPNELELELIRVAASFAGIAIERSEVRLPGGLIRLVGEHHVKLHLHTDVEIDLPVNVIAED